MGSANDGRKKIQRLKEQKMMPRKLTGGKMYVFIMVCHCSKPNWSSNSFRERSEPGVVTFEMDRNVILDIFRQKFRFNLIFF